jgi:SAM-dependent methyltransferase
VSRGAAAGPDSSGRAGAADRYDRSYFERFYRGPRRVHSADDQARRARMVLGIAEYMLGRPARSVLDVGCGEGEWRGILRRLRPGIRWVGVDPSEYVVRRFGARRGIRRGTFAALDEARVRGPFDVMVCAGVLNYLTEQELRRGLGHVRGLLGGVAFLELFTSADEVEGDVAGWATPVPARARALLRGAGLRRCGPHCYVGPEFVGVAAELEADGR